MKTWIKIGIGVVLMLVVVGAASGSWMYFRRGNCEVSPATVKELIEYVRGKARVPPNVTLEFGYAEPVGDTCYQAVHLRAKDRPGPDMIVYLSPDQRFMSRDLIDWKIDKVLNPPTAGQPEAQSKLPETEFKSLTDSRFPARGASDAPITIALFTDFQCPYCKQQAESLSQLTPKEVRVAFHHMPLPTHAWAMPAAEMTGCIRKQSDDAFWSVHDSLYENQTTLSPETVSSHIRSVVSKRKDVNAAAYDACVASHASAPDVQADMALVQRYGLRSTPTMFINGVRMEGVMTPDKIRRLAAGPPKQQQSPDSGKSKE